MLVPMWLFIFAEPRKKTHTHLSRESGVRCLFLQLSIPIIAQMFLWAECEIMARHFEHTPAKCLATKATLRSLSHAIQNRLAG